MIPTEMEALPSTVMGVDQQSRHGRTDDAKTLREGGHSVAANNETIPSGRTSSNFEIDIS